MRFARVILVASLLALAPAEASAARRSVLRVAGSISVCCAWDTGIADGISFSVRAPEPPRGVMIAAIRQWAAVVPGLRLVEVQPGTDADVEVRFQSISGNTQGRTSVHQNRARLIQFAEVVVAGSFYGRPNSQDVLAQITKHEFGHALGLKHANGNGDLMSPTLVDGAQQISACDVRAVTAANHWHLVAKSSQPSRPSSILVRC